MDIRIPSVMDAQSEANFRDKVLKYSRVNATGPGTNTTIAASLSPTKMNIASADFTNNIFYDATNHRFKILFEAEYSVTGAMYYSNPATANVSYQMMVYKNGALLFADYETTAAGIGLLVSATKIVALKKNDYLELYGQTGSGSTNTTSGSLSYLSISLA